MENQLLLASRSPRRQDLLRQLGLRFALCAADVLEQPRPGEAATDYACRMALAKAHAGRQASGTTMLPVLGADTDVVLDGEVLGKPADRDHGIALLQRLSGRTHQVVSAVALVDGARQAVRLSVTEVCFGDITPAMAQAYWASGEPADKAGGYAIQGLGAAFVREIRGSYSGVVGLPLYETCELLRDFGIEVVASAVSRPPSHTP
ncbi:Maf family protein [Sinimarinibacterium thermocellulolyticum]|uniref:dTTP/UTP pyrophosphatase n=1 Tax=Sinimarinibacterium thermocellulolyticum TaxID=3170016 RepID=A0ABV2A6R7_9GAMM